MPRRIITTVSVHAVQAALFALLSSLTSTGCARAFASTSSDGSTPIASFAVAKEETKETSSSSSSASSTSSTKSDADAGAAAVADQPVIVRVPYTGPRSPALRGGTLHSPMPGGFLGGWNGDTGLDIAGNRLDVYAIGAGTLDYAEWGHTLWTRGRDTAYSVRLALDEPIPWGKDGERKITHVYYTHLSKVETSQAEGATTRKHVEAGEKIAVSGIGNGVPHLHLGLLLDNQVEQDSWTFILREGDIRKVFGNYRNGELLPLIATPKK